MKRFRSVPDWVLVAVVLTASASATYAGYALLKAVAAL